MQAIPVETLRAVMDIWHRLTSRSTTPASEFWKAVMDAIDAKCIVAAPPREIHASKQREGVTCLEPSA
jgi:hypothetical protein